LNIFGVAVLSAEYEEKADEWSTSGQELSIISLVSGHGRRK
jgi:hypothetical protein